MKLVTKHEFEYSELRSEKIGEIFSQSALLSQALGSQQLFIHHDIIKPGHRSSSEHRHSMIEEIVYVIKGNATAVEGENVILAEEGSIIIFHPQSQSGHYVKNESSETLETITFAKKLEFDQIIFESDIENRIQRPTSHFDQNLRDVPDHPEEWAQFVISLETKLKNETHTEFKLIFLEHLGMALRTMNRLAEAEFYLKKALTLSYNYPRHSRLVQNLVRLAHVYQWKREFGKAHLLFDQAKSVIDSKGVSEGLRASYHQHLGKLYFEQNNFGLAQAEFATALSIRQRISAPVDQIESSASSFAEAQKRWGKIASRFLIRRAVDSDAESIHRAHMKSIQEICSKDHSSEEISVWGHRPYREEHRVGAIHNDYVCVVENEGSVEGYGHLKIVERGDSKSGHIMGLYLTPKIVGRGVGKMISEIILEYAKHSQVRSITLESTITAHKFYEKIGFGDSGPEMTIEMNGTPIRCYPMKMEI